jgi:serine phosphatase RsbU (regulator of sigma subunit)
MSKKAMSKKAMSKKAMSAELNPISDPPKHWLNRPTDSAGGCSRGAAKIKRAYRADKVGSDSCDVRQLALGAASEVCPQGVPASQEGSFGSNFADVVPLGKGRVALALGDVRVTGPTAALCVPQVLYALRQILREPVQPACVLNLLNRFLCRSGLPAGCPSVALSLLVVDVGTGRTVSACAGSEPTLILRADGGVEAVNSGRTPLGVDPGQAYRTVDFLLGKGDALLLATDGITKSRRLNSEWSSESLECEGLAGLALDAFVAGGPPGQMARMVLEGVRAFTGGPLQNEASVLVAIRH